MVFCSKPKEIRSRIKTTPNMLYNGSRVNAACCNRSSKNSVLSPSMKPLMNVRRNKILTSASLAFESSDHPANSFLGVIVAGLFGVSYIYFLTYISPLR